MAYSVKEIFYTLQGEGAHAGRAAVFCRFTGCNLWTGLERNRLNAVCQFCDTDFVGTDGVRGGKFDQPERLADAIAATWGELGDVSACVGKPAARGRGTTASSSSQAVHAALAAELDSADQPRQSAGAISAISQQAAAGQGVRYVVLTGGEPMLQVDSELLIALKARGFEIAVETNGTRHVPREIDWICVSPKAGAELVQRTGDELKLIYPQPGAEPELFAHLNFRHFYLQPMDVTSMKSLKPAMRKQVQATNQRQCLEYCLANPQWRLSLQTQKILDIP